MIGQLKSGKTVNGIMQVNRHELAVVMNEMKRLGGDNVLQQSNYVHLYSEDDRLVVQVNILDTVLTATLKAEGSLGQPTCMPSVALHKLVKRAKKGSNDVVVFEDKGSAVEGCDITVDGLKTILRPGMAPDQYVVAKPGVDGNSTVREVSDLGVLRSSFEHVLISVSDDMSRPHIYDIALLEFDDSKQFAVSTNGHRMHYGPLPLKEHEGKDAPFTESVVVSKQFLDVAVRVLAKHLKNGKASFEVSDKQVMLSVGDDRINWAVVIKRTDQAFSSGYQHVTPDTSSQRNAVSILRNDLVNVVKRMNDINESAGAMVNLEGGVLTFSIKDPEASTPVNCKSIRQRKKAEHRKFGINLKYVLDALRAKQDDAVVLTFVDELSPIMFDHGGGFRALIMVMRV